MLTPDQMQANFAKALRTMDEFAAGEAAVQKAAKKIARRLEELGIPYVVAGGLAVAANGLERPTVDVDLILTRDGLKALKEHCLGLGWVERVKRAKGLRDAEYDLKIDVLTTDEKPGDGKSCPFHSPHPASVGQPFSGIWSGMRMLDLRTLLELKLASWITSPHRPRDMDDVIRLIKIHDLPRTYAWQLHEYVRAKYDELWALAQVSDPHDE